VVLHKYRLFPQIQALPYVALLIAMLFFIYAVIGMQVWLFDLSADQTLHCKDSIWSFLLLTFVH
jgi:hypothetical protein